MLWDGHDGTRDGALSRGGEQAICQLACMVQHVFAAADYVRLLICRMCYARLGVNLLQADPVTSRVRMSVRWRDVAG